VKKYLTEKMKNLPSRLFNRYKNFALVTLPRFYRKIPQFVWFLGGAFGFFAAGVLFTLFSMGELNENELDRLNKSNDEYIKLISGYEELSDLYSYQGQNVGVITDPYVLTNNPAEFYDALDSIKDYKDRILVQQGRIMELRKTAGMKDTKEYPNSQ
jgi:hypothetical protein